MRKRIINSIQQRTASPDQGWLNVEDIAEVEVTSEDAAHPIESALLPGLASGGAPLGRESRPLRRIWLNLVEPRTERTQEYVLRWSADDGQSFREIVRQQWNFSPQGSPSETEVHHVELPAVTVLELSIIPDTWGKCGRFFGATAAWLTPRSSKPPQARFAC
ncbi:MAG: carbohydrate-binding protein [Steroidobacteraceae bacterium]